MRDIWDDEEATWLSMSSNARPKWTLAEASVFVQKLEKHLKLYRWGVSLYGSVLHNGEGRDLDLLLTPFGKDAEDMFSLARHLPMVGIQPVGIPAWGHRQEVGALSWIWEDAQERAVDLAFWRHPNG